MKTKTEEMYATMSPWRLFFIVALPGMVSMFAMSIYNIIEGTMLIPVNKNTTHSSYIYLFVFLHARN